MESKDFDLYGNIIKINSDLEIFNEIYSKFYEESWNCYIEFLNEIEGIGDIQELLKKVGDLTLKTIDDFIIKALYYLKKHNVNISKAEFENEFRDSYFSHEKIYDKFVDVCFEIIKQESERKEHRMNQRRARTPGKWEGIGFGISGAIAATINSAILNVGTDMARSLGDYLVDSIDNYQNKTTVRSFSKSAFFESYALELRKLCINIGVAAYTKLYKVGLVEKEEFQAKDITQRLDYLKNSSLPIKKQIEGLLYCIRLYPYDFDIYQQLFEIYGDCDLYVARLAKYFGFKYELYIYYTNVAGSHLATLCEMPEDTPTRCEQKYNAFVQSLKDYNIANDDLSYNLEASEVFYTSEIYHMVTQEIDRLRDKAFVVNGMTFENAAQKERYILQKQKQEAERIAQKYRREKIRGVIITIAIIGFVIFLGIKLIPKAFNFALDMVTSASISIDRTKALNESESKYFENSSVLNYHRWFDGELIKSDVNTPNNGRTYQRYIYSYENEKYPKQYMDMLVNDGFTKVSTETPQKDEKITITRYKKMNPQNNEKTLTVQVSIYHDRDTVSIMFNID